MLGKVDRGAVISCDKQYRYTLWRIWDNSKPKVAFIGLNPSTADDKEDDPTIKKCIKFAKLWGYGGIYMLNLFALRSTDPSKLYVADDPIGSQNNEHILDIANKSELVIAAWGNHGKFQARSNEVCQMVSNLFCLDINKTGEPKHPLYIRSDAKPFQYSN